MKSTLEIFVDEQKELELFEIAQWHEDDNVAREAMKELIEKYDKTYFYCSDCDGLLVKESECCLNKNLKISADS